MMAMLWAQQIMLGKKTYSQVPRLLKDKVKEILNYRPEAVYAEGNLFTLYPLVQALKEKHISVYTSVEKEGRRFLMKIASYM